MTNGQKMLKLFVKLMLGNYGYSNVPMLNPLLVEVQGRKSKKS